MINPARPRRTPRTVQHPTTARRTARTPTTTQTSRTQTRQDGTAPNLRDYILADFETLRIPVTAEQFDRTLGQAEQEHLAPLEFLSRLIGEQANLRRQRSIERRIREAHFREHKTLEEFDWEFNASAIDRVQIEELATGEFIRRGDNLVLVGQSGVGKSHLMQALGVRFCAAGYRVRYTTSAELLSDLTASLADQTLPKRLRYWSRFDLVMIDEFGFDKIERSECPQAANLFYKIIDARSGQRSTALATNIDTDAWNDYLGDPPLAMAFYDRIAYRAIPLKIEGKSYRAHRVKRPSLRQQSPET